MKKNLCYLFPFWLLLAFNAQAAPGEFWELTSAMEGMGMTMPAQTSKECLPLKDEGEPAGVDKNCKVTDLKHIPNGSTWKMSCNDGTTGSGKQTRTKDTITSDVLMNSSDGSMKMSMKGKRVGGSCDTGEKLKPVLAEIEKTCDLKNKKTEETVLMASNYTKSDGICASRKEPFCSLVKRELPNDKKAFEAFDQHLKVEPGSNAAKACGLNGEAARQSLCKANASNRKELGFLDRHCPSEAKVLRQKIREEECSGRQFTAAGDKTKCLAGIDLPTEDSPGSSSATTEQGTSKSGNATTDAVKEGTKALKGLKDAFGF